MKRTIAFAIAFGLTLLVLLAAPATSNLQSKKKLFTKARAISNSYIVVLEDWGTDSRGEGSVAALVARDLSASYGGKIKHVYKHALQGYAAEMSETEARALSLDPRVKFVEEDGEVRAATVQTNVPWGIDRIDQRDRPLNANFVYTTTGAGVHVYIVDTGIRITHTQFGGRASVAFDSVNDGWNGLDCNGHGTHVAGTVGASTYGVAKGVTLHSVRVLGCNELGSEAQVIAGVDWITANAQFPAVANMSLSGGASAAVDTAVRNSIASGITYTIAAGNSNANACNISPARVQEALTVGATTAVDARLTSSNIGACLDLFAPGSGILSAWNTSDTATKSHSGTSMAAPHVAGMAAQFLQNFGTALPADVATYITSRATLNHVTAAGAGSPNRLLYSGPICTDGALYSGMLTGAGGFQFQPNGGSIFINDGYHLGCLQGPANANFDLFLEKWNGSAWTNVATASHPGSIEEITYLGTSGAYRWKVLSISGSGNYTLWLEQP